MIVTCFRKSHLGKKQRYLLFVLYMHFYNKTAMKQVFTLNDWLRYYQQIFFCLVYGRIIHFSHSQYILSFVLN